MTATATPRLVLQPSLFDAPVLHQCGKAQVIVFDDGRALLEVRTDRGPAWLEIDAATRQWLLETLAY